MSRVVIVSGTGTQEDPYVLLTEEALAATEAPDLEAPATGDPCCTPESCTCCTCCTCGCQAFEKADP